MRLATILSILISGCGSSQVLESLNLNEERIFRNYSIEQDLDEGVVRTVATFSLGSESGNPVRLSPPSRVAVNRMDMTSRESALVDSGSGPYYTRTLTLREAGPQTEFSWHRLDGTLLLTSQPLSEPAEIIHPRNGDLVSRRRNLSFELSPGERADRISMELVQMSHVGTNYNEQGQSLLHKTFHDSQEMRIRSDELRMLMPGRYQLRISKHFARTSNALEREHLVRIERSQVLKRVFITIMED